jgi:hypothetical protein
MKRLENAGFEWNVRKTFDERFDDLWRLKQSMGTIMRLKHGQETINTILWEGGAATSDGPTKLSKREEYRELNYPKQTSNVLRKLVLNGVSKHISIKIDYFYSIGLFITFLLHCWFCHFVFY